MATLHNNSRMEGMTGREYIRKPQLNHSCYFVFLGRTRRKPQTLRPKTF
jgi:hypothetical protein